MAANKNYITLMIAIVLLLAGLYLGGWIGGGVSAEDQARCEKIIASKYDDPETVKMLSEKCSDEGMVAMMDAQNNNLGAQETAQNIAKANRGGLLSLLLAGAMVGAGIGMLATALRGIVRSKKASDNSVEGQ